eukprot:TRINITY_DN2643_c1_g1_i2.p1 TRINITY_DN2643_c1_g1~~TRINITY_DN2643_c1_g1_i2.p1  ORF type:complete len:691 (+),score=189.92 TRINITY_DN2643_c1_g1_i2:92-2164(+)
MFSVLVGMMAATSDTHIMEAGECFHRPGCHIVHKSETEGFSVEGMNPETLANNWGSKFVVGDYEYAFKDILVFIFACFTGMLAGSDRATDLADPQKSIPIGMFSSVIVSGILYFVFFMFWASVAEAPTLQCAEFVAGDVAWPDTMVAVVGVSILSLGAGLQCLAAAPGILSGIADDGMLPYAEYFSQPKWSLLATGVVAELFLLSDSLELLALFVCMFYLLCYTFTNFSCFVLSALSLPSWRPRFKYHHWFLSLLGGCLGFTLMFVIDIWIALVSLGVAITAYLFMLKRAGNLEHGVGVRGMMTKLSRMFLLQNLKIERRGASHTSVIWSPQCLAILGESVGSVSFESSDVLTLVQQLQAKGGGICIAADVFVGQLSEMKSRIFPAENVLGRRLQEMHISGCPRVVVADTPSRGVNMLIQASGLVGDLQPNTVVMEWPEKWREDPSVIDAPINAIADAAAVEKTFLLTKCKSELDTVLTNHRLAERRTEEDVEEDDAIAQDLPGPSQSRFGLRPLAHSGGHSGHTARKSDTLDVWALDYASALLLMMTHLIRKHFESVRLFTIVPPTDELATIMQQTIRQRLYLLRIESSVNVLPLTDASQIAMYFSELDEDITEERLKDLHTNWIPRCQKLNLLLREKSSDADLVLMTMPIHIPTLSNAEYAEGIEELTGSLSHVVLAAGVSGFEYTSA